MGWKTDIIILSAMKTMIMFIWHEYIFHPSGLLMALSLNNIYNNEAVTYGMCIGIIQMLWGELS